MSTRLVGFVIAVVVVLGLFGLSSWSSAEVAAVDTQASDPLAADPLPSQSEVQSDLSKFGSLDSPQLADGDDLAPDLTLLIQEPGQVDDEWVAAARREILGVAGVQSVAVDFLTAEQTVFHLWLDGRVGDSLEVAEVADGVEVAVVPVLPGDNALEIRSIQTGGRALSDEAIGQRFTNTVRWLYVLAALAAVAVGWRLGWKRGLLLLVAWLGSLAFGASIGDQVTGSFDGTIATTPLPAALAALALAVVVTVRLLAWFEQPEGEDGATMIRHSLARVIGDIALVLGGFVVVIGLLWIVGVSVAALVGVVVGALVGSALTAAVVAPGLTALHDAADQDDALVPWPPAFPDGSQLMLVAALGFVSVLAVLGAFAFRSTGVDLVDYRALSSDDSTRAVGQLLGAGPGDPSEAIIATVNSGTADDNAAWAKAAVNLPGVAWVDTAEVRYVAAEERAIEPEVSLASEESLGIRSPAVSVIVPSVPIRSAEGAELITGLRALSDNRVELAGGAGSLQRGSTPSVIAIVVLLALLGAGAVMVVTENLGAAATSLILRLLGGAAVVGIYRLVAPSAPAAETVASLALVVLIVGLFELEFLGRRRLNVGGEAKLDLTESFASGNLTRLGALLGAGALTVAALITAATRFLGGGPTVGRFGLALLLALIVETLIGLVVLRPILLGERAIYHTVARPFRSTMHSGARSSRSKPVSVNDPSWQRLISTLLIAEFRLQTDPRSNRLDDVFLEDTPLHKQAADQHRNLTSAGLRVTGRAPQIRKVETFREGLSTMLSVTVDHPERHLIDGDGNVYGVRQPERRSSMLWLTADEQGRYRIAEAIELGSVPIDSSVSETPPVHPETAGVGH